jgi:hypothetical protein
MKLKLDYKKCHEGLWNWLAKNPDKRKEEWPGFKTMEILGLEHPLMSCFACAVFKHCKECQVDFGTSKKGLCTSEDISYYRKFRHSLTPLSEKSHYAQLIANGWK